MPENTPPGRVRESQRAVARHRWALLLVPGLALSAGCLYGGREAADETVKEMASRPYDLLPDKTPPGENPKVPPAKDTAAKPAASTVQTDLQTAAYMQGAPPGKGFQLHVPEAIPGSEAPLLTLPADPAARSAALARLYPPLPPLEPELKALPGPNGQPYTLSDLQRIAAENSPTLRQAAFDVQASLGNMRQTAAYANPTFSLQEQPSNNSSTSAAFGGSVDQVINTGGKQQIQVAAAKKQYDNAVLALRRARSDLATQVRTAYYALLVAKETMRVTRALSVMTDEVYRMQLALTQNAGQSAAYEPAALRAQAWLARLAYTQAVYAYAYAWKLVVQAMGERQLPLSEVAGRIDAVVPYYEYDKVLGHVLQSHTDVLTATNGVEVAKYNLKYNRVLPYYPNLDFNIGFFKDQALFPFGSYATFTVSAPLPVWDQNRGAILSAEAALGRALEEPHRVELALTNTLATNYQNYLSNLKAIEDYSKYILPDQVRAYRGTLLRRNIDQTAQFGDLVAAQQALASSVTTYLGMLGTLWTSVVSVADLLQTDDLFQNAEVRGLPPLPTDDLEHLPPLPCCHPYGHAGTTQAGPGCQPPASMPLQAPSPLPPAAAAPAVPQPTPTIPSPMPTPNNRPALPPTMPIPNAANVPSTYPPQFTATPAATVSAPTYASPATASSSTTAPLYPQGVGPPAYAPPVPPAAMYAPPPAAGPTSAVPAAVPNGLQPTNLSSLQEAGPGIIPSVFPNQ